MPIEVECECGKRFRAKDEYAGKRGICPACKRSFVVPVPVDLETVKPWTAIAPQAEIEIEKRRLMDAPLVIAVVSFTRPHPKVPPWEQELSAGASAMNIVTAATALGYGANWLTGWFAFDRDVLDGLGLKADERLAGFIHVGTATKPNEDRPRPVLSDIVTRF